MKPVELKAARMRLRLTQEQFAVKLRVHRLSVIRWETGTHKIPYMLKLALKQLAREHYQALAAKEFLEGKTKKVQAESKELTNLELQRIVWACLTYWHSEPNPVDERALCYSWVVRCYRAKFGETFHQVRLQQLARLGLLAKEDTSRLGRRRYYRINDPAQLAEFLKDCKFDPAPSPDLAPVHLP